MSGVPTPGSENWRMQESLGKSLANSGFGTSTETARRGAIMSGPVHLSLPLLQEVYSVLNDEAGQDLPQAARGAAKGRGPFGMPIQVRSCGGHDSDRDLPFSRPPYVDVRWVVVQGGEPAIQSWNGECMDPAQNSALPPACAKVHVLGHKGKHS